MTEADKARQFLEKWVDKLPLVDMMVDYVTDTVTLKRYPQFGSIESLKPVEEVYHQLRETTSSSLWRQGSRELFDKIRQQTSTVSDAVVEMIDDEWWAK